MTKIKKKYEIDTKNTNQFCNFTADHEPENTKQKTKIRQSNVVKLSWKE